MKLLLTLLFAFVLSSPYSQKLYRNIEWHDSHGTVSGYQKLTSATDYNNYVIVVGTVHNTFNNSDVMLTKLDPEGNEVWQFQYDNSNNGNDIAVDLQIDQNNDVFISFIKEFAGTSSFGLLKISESGSLIFENDWSYSNNQHNVCSDIVLDANGYIYIVGGTAINNGFSDIAIVRFDPSGSFDWEQIYDNNGYHDAATFAMVEGSDLLVTGAVGTSITNFEIASLKIDCSNGMINNTYVSSASGIGIDGVNGLKIDANGNIYLIGHEEVNSNKNLKLIKLDNNLNLI